MTTKSSTQNTKDIGRITTDVAVILNKVDYIQSEVRGIKTQLEGEYVTKDKFAPVERIVYGMVSVVLLAVIGALVALVVKK